MTTIKEYLDLYGLHSFKEEGWNEVDNILFSIFSYLPLEKVWKEESYSIKELVTMLIDHKRKEYTPLVNTSVQYLKKASTTNRYQDLKFSNFISNHSDEGQFGAITIHFDDALYIAYRGTDNSVVGWKEDFALSYQYPVFAQREALEYLKQYQDNPQQLYVGGHSKGGNLAMMAAMSISPAIWSKIKAVYNNDGPGFKLEEQKTAQYQRLEEKLHVIVPEESVVGMLLYGTEKIQVIRSKAHGISQHDPTNWLCYGAYFIPGTLSATSKKIQEKNIIFFERLSLEKRKKVVETFFEVIRSTGVTTLREFKKLSFSKVSELFHSTKNLDEESKQILLEILKLLLPVPPKSITEKRHI